MGRHKKSCLQAVKRTFYSIPVSARMITKENPAIKKEQQSEQLNINAVVTPFSFGI